MVVECMDPRPGQLSPQHDGVAKPQPLSQQDGFIHAGISSTIMDSACGYAAFTLMPAEARVLTIEFKVNLLAPAAGERFVAHGRVKKPGRSITVAEGEFYAFDGEQEKLVASMSGTLMTLLPR